MNYKEKIMTINDIRFNLKYKKWLKEKKKMLRGNFYE